MKIRTFTAIYSAVVLLAFVLFLLFPARYLQCVRDGVSLWAVSVLPAAFPLLFLTGLLAGTPLFTRFARVLFPFFRLFGVSGAGGCCACLSMLSGYPAGAKSIADVYMRGALSKNETLRAAALASTSGPAFLVGVAGAAMAGKAALGWAMLGSHFIGVLLPVFILARFTPKQIRESAIALPGSADVPKTLSASVLAVLTVGGAVALFYCFGCMLSDLLAPLCLPETLCNILVGLMEMTSGCARLLAAPTALHVALATFLITFGGLCVLLQQWTFLAETGIPLGKFLLIKLAQAVTAALLAYPLALGCGAL